VGRREGVARSLTSAQRSHQYCCNTSLDAELFQHDRFIPVREGGLSEQYDLLPEPSSAQTKGRPMPTTSGIRTINHYKNGSYTNLVSVDCSCFHTSMSLTLFLLFCCWPLAQNQAHDTVIANELQLTHLHSPQEKLMQNTPRRLFTFSSTTTHNTMHFDSPSRQIYSTTPVSQESRNILLSPKKAPRSISKVPFKVLDAPELRVCDWIRMGYHPMFFGLHAMMQCWLTSDGFFLLRLYFVDDRTTFT